ncbi:response regulator [Limosilactobacillus reuteri]|nr:response regulator [Limosilactobacillus reuteri]WLR78769.1 response regulator [Limosilactobacillus reuteri]
MPIIMITARSQTSDISMALDQGLDDYITKPFEIEELLARIRVVLRRLGQEKSREI